MAVLDHSQLETLWILHGGLESAADTAAAIAQAESGGDTSRINNTAYPSKPDYHPVAAGNLKEFSVGLWQINLLAHPLYTETQMLTEAGNAGAAVSISSGGLSFSAWSTFQSGAYKKFLTGTVSVTPEPGSTFQGGAPASTASGHRGYADLRNSVARHLPTQLTRSRRSTNAALQTLAHGRRVKH